MCECCIAYRCLYAAYVNSFSLILQKQICRRFAIFYQVSCFLYREALKHNVIAKEHRSYLHHVESLKSHKHIIPCSTVDCYVHCFCWLVCVPATRYFIPKNFQKVTHPVVAMFCLALKTRNFFSDQFHLCNFTSQGHQVLKTMEGLIILWMQYFHHFPSGCIFF